MNATHHYVMHVLPGYSASGPLLGTRKRDPNEADQGNPRGRNTRWQGPPRFGDGARPRIVRGPAGPPLDPTPYESVREARVSAALENEAIRARGSRAVHNGRGRLVFPAEGRAKLEARARGERVWEHLRQARFSNSEEGGPRGGEGRRVDGVVYAPLAPQMERDISNLDKEQLRVDAALKAFAETRARAMVAVELEEVDQLRADLREAEELALDAMESGGEEDEAGPVLLSDYGFDPTPLRPLARRIDPSVKPSLVAVPAVTNSTAPRVISHAPLQFGRSTEVTLAAHDRQWARREEEMNARIRRDEQKRVWARGSGARPSFVTPAQANVEQANVEQRQREEGRFLAEEAKLLEVLRIRLAAALTHDRVQVVKELLYLPVALQTNLENSVQEIMTLLRDEGFSLVTPRLERMLTALTERLDVQFRKVDDRYSAVEDIAALGEAALGATNHQAQGRYFYYRLYKSEKLADWRQKNSRIRQLRGAIGKENARRRTENSQPELLDLPLLIDRPIWDGVVPPKKLKGRAKTDENKWRTKRAEMEVARGQVEKPLYEALLKVLKGRQARWQIILQLSRGGNPMQAPAFDSLQLQALTDVRELPWWLRSKAHRAAAALRRGDASRNEAEFPVDTTRPLGGPRTYQHTWKGPKPTPGGLPGTLLQAQTLQDQADREYAIEAKRLESLRWPRAATVHGAEAWVGERPHSEAQRAAAARDLWFTNEAAAAALAEAAAAEERVAAEAEVVLQEQRLQEQRLQAEAAAAEERAAAAEAVLQEQRLQEQRLQRLQRLQAANEAAVISPARVAAVAVAVSPAREAPMTARASSSSSSSKDERNRAMGNAYFRNGRWVSHASGGKDINPQNKENKVNPWTGGVARWKPGPGFPNKADGKRKKWVVGGVYATFKDAADASRRGFEFYNTPEKKKSFAAAAKKATQLRKKTWEIQNGKWKKASVSAVPATLVSTPAFYGDPQAAAATLVSAPALYGNPQAAAAVAMPISRLTQVQIDIGRCMELLGLLNLRGTVNEQAADEYESLKLRAERWTRLLQGYTLIDQELRRNILEFERYWEMLESEIMTASYRLEV